MNRAVIKRSPKLLATFAKPEKSRVELPVYRAYSTEQFRGVARLITKPEQLKYQSSNDHTNAHFEQVHTVHYFGYKRNAPNFNTF